MAKRSGGREEIMKVLSNAILRETAAFNFYSKKAEEPSIPPGVKGLLSRLAEEERNHRHLLVNEYVALSRGWKGDGGGGADLPLSYDIPEKLPFLSVKVSPDLEAAALSLPGVLVGGDNVFSSVLRDRGGRATGTILFIYDVMGHSIETTEINAMAARVCGEFLEACSSARMKMELLGPKNIISNLNRNLSEKFEGQGIFLTMLCAVFDSRMGSLKYTSAGHEPPFLVHTKGRVESLVDTQLLVGIDPNYEYRDREVSFGRDAVFCGMTDGIVEAENEGEEIVGRARLAGVLERSWRKPAEEIVSDILKEVKGHCSGAPLKDEVSIAVVKSRRELSQGG